MREFKVYVEDPKEMISQYLMKRVYQDGSAIFSAESVKSVGSMLFEYGLSFAITNPRVAYTQGQWEDLVRALYGFRESRQVIEELRGLADNGTGSLVGSRIMVDATTVEAWLKGKR